MYVLAADTCYVESFNNVSNIHYSKKVRKFEMPGAIFSFIVKIA